MMIDFSVLVGYIVSNTGFRKENFFQKRFEVLKKVEAYIEKNHMIEEGDTVVAGVSGGADSVCLFYILKEYCLKKNARLVVVHVNHMIRDEASKDADFVEKFCHDEGIEFYLFEKDIPTLAASKGVGTEEAGRMARYEAFEEVRAHFSEKGKIAVAHNRNDQAETTLFHLLRGAGLTGLSGIQPVRDHIIRPLLCVDRKEIEAYLTENEKKWCIDFTNGENTYTRNKLRNVVFPYVEKEVCAQAVNHIASAAEELSQVRDYVEQMTTEAERQVLLKEDDFIRIQVDGFMKLHPVLQKQILLNAFSYLVPSRKDFASVHIYDLLKLFDKGSGKQIHLPYKLTAIREFDRVSIGRVYVETDVQKVITVSAPGKIEFEPGKYMEFTIFSADKLERIEQKTYTKWFDYDKIINCLTLRNRKIGDYLIINAQGARKTIKDYFIGEKVPRLERDSKLLLADGQHILWVVGMRISEAYKITEHTKTVLQVTILE